MQCKLETGLATTKIRSMSLGRRKVEVKGGWLLTPSGFTVKGGDWLALSHPLRGQEKRAKNSGGGWMLEKKKGAPGRETQLLSLLSTADSMRLEVMTPSFVTFMCLQRIDGGLQLLRKGHRSTEIMTSSAQGHRAGRARATSSPLWQP